VGDTMKKRRILWSVLVFVLLACGALLLWQWNNVQALAYLVSMDDAQLQERNKQNEEQFNEIMEEYNLNKEDFSPGENQNLTEGSQDVNDMAMPLAGIESEPEEEKVNTIQRPKESIDYTEEIRVQVAKMYVLKSTFVGRLESIVAKAKSEYSALPAEERTNDAKMKIVQSKSSQIAALEKECDAEVAEVVSELQRLLKESGQDQTLVDKVKTVYAQEKSLKKAYYMKELNS